jgi:hypothetical protein
MIITHSFGSLSPFPSFSPFSSRLFTSPYFLLKSDISPKSDIPLEFSLYLSTAFLISMAHPPLTVAIPAGI